MLFDFLETHRAELIARTRAKVASRSAPRPTEDELEHGVPLFLDQLGETLRLSLNTSDEISRSAGIHGRELLRKGFTVAQVVHDYGDICQAVTELAAETNAEITVDEFRTLNRCLDDAIATAVTEYTAQRERSLSDEGAERLGSLVDEIRTRLSTAMLSFSLLRTGHVGIGGSTSAILGRNLRTVCNHVDRTFAELHLASGKMRRERVLVSQLLEQVEVDGSLEADASGLALTIAAGETGLEIMIDRQLITSALARLLQNAFKFSRPDGHVSLATSSTPEHVVFEIEDRCKGLPPGMVEELGLAPGQRTGARAGVGAGLDVVRRSVEACGGRLSAREVAGRGCIFSMQLPRGA
jgi:signal transduction histidine kinase